MFLRRQILIGSLLAVATRARADTDPWSALREGRALVLMRHATAPGTGDPQGFRLSDCATQRNLSAEGRAQARRIGSLFSDNGVGEARLFSSQWCRCLDTATLLGLGDVQPQPLLNSFFDSMTDGSGQTEALRAWMTALPRGKPVILVSHQVNITALTDIFPASGELVFVSVETGNSLRVVGRLRTG